MVKNHLFLINLCNFRNHRNNLHRYIHSQRRIENPRRLKENRTFKNHPSCFSDIKTTPESHVGLPRG